MHLDFVFFLLILSLLEKADCKICNGMKFGLNFCIPTEIGKAHMHKALKLPLGQNFNPRQTDVLSNFNSQL